ncbi:unnamed protein product [Amaranthus hypochondriacus]
MPPNQPLTNPTLLHLITFIITIIILNPSIKAQHSPPPTQNYGSPLPTNAIIIVIVVCSVGLITCYVRQFTACCTAYLFSATESGTDDQGEVRQRENPRTGGLDPAILASIPTYSFSDVKNLIKKTALLECAVCLNEFVDQELLRLLPGCCHVFHPHCIGRWLASHVTCPVCRANLEIQVDNRNHDQVIQQLNEDDQLQPSDQITQDHNQHDVIVDIVEAPEITVKSPEVHVSKGVGDRRGKFPRSHSTGHSLVENNERFTLRLPDEVRNKLVNVTNLTGLPAAVVSPRTGYRFKRRSTSLTTIPGKPDQWRFTMSPPFISRSGSPETDEYLNNSSNNIMGLIKSPKSLLKSMKSARKSPLNRVSRCDDIGERSSDKLWPNNTNS